MLYRIGFAMVIAMALVGCDEHPPTLTTEDIDKNVPVVETPGMSQPPPMELGTPPREEPQADVEFPRVEPLPFKDDPATRYSEYATPESRERERNPYGATIPESQPFASSPGYGGELTPSAEGP